jgi:hypothetical protein
MTAAAIAIRGASASVIAVLLSNGTHRNRHTAAFRLIEPQLALISLLVLILFPWDRSG